MLQYKIVKKISEKTIREKIRTIARDISNEYKNREPVLIGVLNGGFIFLADLIREMSIPLEIDFLRLASYGSKDVSSGKIILTKDIEITIKGRPVIIVEDIIDTGLTMSYLIRYINEKEPESIRICALINKTGRRDRKVEIDYSAFDINEGFLVGYGLDYGEKFRYLPYILSLEI